MRQAADFLKMSVSTFFPVVRLKPSRSLFKFESFKLSPPAAVTIKRDQLFTAEVPKGGVEKVNFPGVPFGSEICS
jgi:hypothetical protein